MMTQYLEIKSRYPDTILFYRMGDFYEMFGPDALTAAPVLEVQLTARDRNSENPMPMCGVPHHSAQVYLQRLLNKGFKVALCEQLEDPATTKGLVKRDVVRVLTPALIGDPDLVAPESKNTLAVFCATKRGSFELALLDLLAGNIRHGELADFERLLELLTLEAPKEFLIEKGDDAIQLSRLRERFPEVVVTERAFGRRTQRALQAMHDYLRETQKLERFELLSDPGPLEPRKTLGIDSVSLSSLEVLAPLRPGGRSLFDVLDDTSTAMGRRLLKDWLAHPSTDPEVITGRWDAVENLAHESELAKTLRAELVPLRDLERLNTKTALGLSMPRDLGGIRDVLLHLPQIKNSLGKASSARLQELGTQIDLLSELSTELDRALDDTLPLTLRDGGIFRDTYHPEVQRLRTLSGDAKRLLAEMEARERENSGIPSLKLKFSKVFGYTIEITKSHLAKVPSHYIRKQTIAGGERFITAELKAFEDQLTSAEHKLKTLEESLFTSLRASVADFSPQLAENARILAEVDVLGSFARVSRERDYRRAELGAQESLAITDGRHPVVESLLPPGKFVPNSLSIDADSRTLILTGPNMGGKSTAMRQVALMSLMAQAGCFVPARSAVLPLIDAIYTRIGSADDLATGRSTFMVEMTEMSRILRSATERSLILIDEIGRGTSTYDGLSLAWSLLDYIHRSIRAKTLFATHFHELTQLEQRFTGIRNMSVGVQEWEGKIVFQYRLVPGASSRSYGIEVAQLAGIPAEVVDGAKSVLRHLEGNGRRPPGSRSEHVKQGDTAKNTDQLVFFS